MFSIVNAGAKRYNTREEAIEEATRMAQKQVKNYGGVGGYKYDIVAVIGTVGIPERPVEIEFTPAGAPKD